MNSSVLYQDIATRTNGDIYIGVVGPMRSGKSTFLKKFMDELVLPNMTDEARRERVIDEMPQSADGRAVMTTEPKFVPEQGVNIDISSDVNVNIRLIDCVGYMIDGVENTDRAVRTPWSEGEMTFAEAAELGTRKVMCEHSTIGVVVTTDGSVTSFPRESYVQAEQKIVDEMIAAGKPFVVLLNTSKPEDGETLKLQEELSNRYGVAVVAKNVQNMNIGDIQDILSCILGEFPLKMINMTMPRWMQMLPLDNEIISKVISEIKARTVGMCKMCDYTQLKDLFDSDDNIKKLSRCKVKYSDGSLLLELEPREGLFYKVLSDVCGIDIRDESALFGYIKQSTEAVATFDKMKSALDSVEECGYGVIIPRDDEVEFATPQFVGEGSKRAVKMTAKCTCLHIMRVEVDTEVNPVLAGGAQGQEMVGYLEKEYQDDLGGIWHTNMFGKELMDIARDNLNAKMYNMPQDAQNKLRKTVGRIVNEAKGGVLCVLL